MKNKSRLPAAHAVAGWLSSIALAAALAACGGGGAPATPGLQAQAAKASESCSFTHVYVTVQAVQAVQEIGGIEQLVNIALPAPRRIDLLNLGGGFLQALGAALLGEGHYLGLRLVLTSNSSGDPLADAAQTGGGELAALTVPSGQQSGLKLNADFTVAAGQFADVAPQGFDACSAITSTGSSGQLNLKPSIAVAAQAVGGPETRQSFSGTVMPLLGGGFVTVAHDFNAGTWTLQRFDAAGQPVGTPTTITAAAGQVANIAPLTSGGYAIVSVVLAGTWQGSDGNFHSVFQVNSQSFTAEGAAIGSPLPIATVDPGALSRPAAVPQVAGLANGGFVIVWGLQRSFGSDTLDTSVYAQRFTAAGAPDGTAQQQVTTVGTGYLGVTGLTTGGYMVTWGDLSGAEGGARAYAADGLPLGPQHDAGTSWDPTLIGATPRGDMQPLAGGGAVMAWAPSHGNLMIQQLAPDGTPLAARVVNTATPTFTFISLGGLPDGGYVVAWQELGIDAIFARRYAADGTSAGEATRVNLFTTNVAGPSVVVLADVRFTISWVGTGTDGVQATYARTFPADALIAAP